MSTNSALADFASGSYQATGIQSDALTSQAVGARDASRAALSSASQSTGSGVAVAPRDRGPIGRG